MDEKYCVKCGNRKKIHRHHTDNCSYFVRRGILTAYEYEQGFDDAIPLCSICHKYISRINTKFARYWWANLGKRKQNERILENYYTLRYLYSIVFKLFLLSKYDFSQNKIKSRFVKEIVSGIMLKGRKFDFCGIKPFKDCTVSLSKRWPGQRS